MYYLEQGESLWERYDSNKALYELLTKIPISFARRIWDVGIYDASNETCTWVAQTKQYRIVSTYLFKHIDLVVPGRSFETSLSRKFRAENRCRADRSNYIYFSSVPSHALSDPKKE